MADLQTVAWWQRPLGLLRGLLGLTERPESPPANADYAGSTERRAPYDPLSAMSAFVAFPWVFACVSALVEDQLSRPFRLSRGEGTAAQRIDRHPLLDLLSRPSSKTPGRVFWAQILADLALTGNAYALILYAPGGRIPVSLIRLHPRRVEIVTDPHGQVEAYVYDGSGLRTRYAADTVLHWRGPSWTDDPRLVFGSGAIEALHQELSAEQALQKRTAAQAKRGRPDAIARPATTTTGAGVWSKEQVRAFAEAINEVFERRDGGIAVLGGQAEISPLGWSPRDLEFPAQRGLTREAVLAVFGVPPTRLQLPTANYAQSTDAMTQYWGGVVGRSRAFCALLTERLCPVFGLPDGQISQDFSDVPYLQAERTARLQRVSAHILNGLSPADAYAYEGFADAPAPAEAPPTPPADPAPRAASSDPRGDLWRGWIARAQSPAERRIRILAASWLRSTSGRVAGRLAVAADLSPGALIGDAWRPEEERAALLAWLGPQIRALTLQGWREAAQVLGEIGAPETAQIPARADAAAQLLLLSTRAEIERQIRIGLEAGDTAADLAARVRSCAAFAPTRAQAIARTEATRALNDGAHDAIAAANRAGVLARKMWLSARDSGVRPSHRALDGQVVEVGAPFRIPAGVEGAGQEADYPGGFRTAAESCNCRCTILPVLE